MELTETFGTKVFSKRVMRKMLPPQVFESLEHTIRQCSRLDAAIAQTVADAMKQWAIEQGATHFTHWFQPMTGITAGKFDAFFTPDGEGGAISSFSAKSLFLGEPDASSFPSGGLRATFEARGYTTWDPTSPAFVKGKTLYIPTAFCAYTGEALDAKTPLLRSMEAVSKEATRLCRAMGMSDVQRVQPVAGAEQEYFIVDRDAYEKRLDLKICGTTLIGARSPKGQELDDHYFGRIRLRIGKYMEEVDKRLWELGVPSKTKHNEAAPAQHELAPLHDSCNIACDHNQLIMETLRLVAKEQGLACLLHEKPFAYVNGSGKHNNYSLGTDTGVNMLGQGKNAADNPLFLVTLCAFLRAVDSYPELLRLSAAGAGNDYRLGACEAPPAIISIFLGDRLLSVLKEAALGGGGEYDAEILNIGVTTSPELMKDDADRNRTSPFAFTGNKFEFRMVGSSQSIAMANTVLNTVLADSMSAMACYFEKAGYTPENLSLLISETLRSHGRIIFNGNNYSQEWEEEAERRGLPNISNSVDAFAALTQEKNLSVFERFGVLSRTECQSRYGIMLENYAKSVNIEAQVLVEMTRRQLLPAVMEYAGKVSKDAKNFAKACGKPQKTMLSQLEALSEAIDGMSCCLEKLEASIAAAPHEEKAMAHYMRDQVRPAMAKLREVCDRAEILTDKKFWPIPTYTDLLHRV
ncbi:MAG: glutamine synthetase III [Angelakisella sp.]|nr:glutamine synthetase III [Angelakisella sp.]